MAMGVTTLILVIWIVVLCDAFRMSRDKMMSRARTPELERVRMHSRANAQQGQGFPLTEHDRARRSTLHTLGRAVGSGALLSALPSMVRASAGAVVTSSLAETQTAAKQLVLLSKLVGEMETLAGNSDWNGVASILTRKEFVEFDKIANILVRSESISAEDRYALGTIKRYGLVADAIIMIGGLQEALRAGGIKMVAASSGYKDQAPIIDDEDDEEEEAVEAGQGKGVDPKEAMKYVKLVKGSLADINQIVTKSKIL